MMYKQLLEDERKALLDSVYLHFLKQRENPDVNQQDKFGDYLLSQVDNLRHAEYAIENQFEEQDVDQRELTQEEFSVVKNEFREFLDRHNCHLLRPTPVKCTLTSASPRANLTR